MTKRVQSGEQKSPASGIRLQALACLALVGSLLGFSLVIGKLAITSGAAPLPFLIVAMLGSGAVLLAGERMQGQAFVFNRRIVEYGLVAGVLFAVPNAIGFLAVAHVGAGFLSLTFAFPILITYILALIIGLDRFLWTRTLAVLLGLSGGIILSLAKISSGDSALFWVVATMMSPVIIAVGNIYRTLRWPSGVSSMYLAALMLICAGFILLPGVLLFGAGEFQNLFMRREILILLTLQTALFAIMYLFYFVLQRLAGPVYLSQIGTIAAVVGTLAAVGLLGEALPKNLLVAAILVGTGTALFQLNFRK